MLNYVTIKKFSELSGYTEDAIRTKIRDGVWLEGKVWIKAPDERNLIILEGYHKWVEMGMASVKHRKPAMKSPSPIRASDVANASRSSPPPLTAAA